MEYPQVTAESMAAVDWDALVSACAEQDCRYFGDEFRKESDRCKASQPERAAALDFALDVMSMGLRPSDARTPFGPLWEMDGRRSALPEDYARPLLKAIAGWATGLKNAELRARFCDLLWVQDKNHSAARVAVLAYLDSAAVLEHPKDWSRGAKRMERALRIALRLGKAGADLKDRVIAVIEEVLARYDGTDPLYLSEHLMGLLRMVGHGDAASYASLARKLAQRAEDEGDFWRAHTYFEREADWHEFASSVAGAATAKRAAAEALVKEANAAMSQPGRGMITSAAILSQAVEAMRQAPGAKDRAEELHKELLRRQAASVGEMHEVSTKTDVREMTAAAIAHVTGKLMLDAVIALCSIAESPNPAELREAVEREARDAPLSALAPMDIVNRAGKVVARAPGLGMGTEDDNEAALRARMFRRAAQSRHRIAYAAINPARATLMSEHNLSLSDVSALIRNSPWIPTGHIGMVAAGLHAGFDLDLTSASHLLVPQFEAVVRRLVEHGGGETSFLDGSRIQQEKPLSALLKMTQALQALGEGGVLELQDLLNDPLGANLRNELAHGLLTDEGCHQADVLYMWWVMLRYCVVTSLIAARHSEGAASPVESNV